METLLNLALALLIAAQQPNVPVELRNTAINVANQAIALTLKSHATITRMDEKSIEADIESEATTTPDFPVAGESGGKTVYKGSGLFIIGDDGCQYSVMKIGNVFKQTGIKLSCPQK